jgi:hypothetical protein
MILTVYQNLASIAEHDFTDIVVSAEIIFTQTQRAQKLRIFLIDETFIDIWLTLDGRYSYHWHSFGQDNFIYRHDNAPHEKWNFISTFPKHCHDGSQENVIASDIPDDYIEALHFFLQIVRKKMIK